MNAEASREAVEETGIPAKKLVVGKQPLSSSRVASKRAELVEHDPNVPSAAFIFKPEVNENADTVVKEYFSEAGYLNGFRHVKPKNAAEKGEHTAFAVVPFNKKGISRFLRLSNLTPGMRVLLNAQLEKMRP